MAKHKSPTRKMHLIKANKRSRSVPAWVIAKTRGRVRMNVKRRHWRRSKLKI